MPFGVRARHPNWPVPPVPLFAPQVARVLRSRGVQSYYTEGVGAYYAAGSPPLPGRWKTRGLGQSQPPTAEEIAAAEARAWGQPVISRSAQESQAAGTGYPSAAEIAAALAAVAPQTAIAAGSPAAASAQVVPVSAGGISTLFSGSTTLLGTSIKNSYLVAAAALGAFVLFGMKKGRR